MQFQGKIIFLVSKWYENLKRYTLLTVRLILARTLLQNLQIHSISCKSAYFSNVLKTFVNIIVSSKYLFVIFHSHKSVAGSINKLAGKKAKQ